MTQQYEPKEHTNHREILNAIKKVDCLSELFSCTYEHLDYELDLEIAVYGRHYKGKMAGPYLRLLSFAAGKTIITQGDWAGNVFFVVVDGSVDVFIEHPVHGERKLRELSVGEQFGARSMLIGCERQATVKAPADRAAQVLEIQRPAVRLLRKLPKFAAKIDEIYRDHGRETAVDDLIQKAGISREFKEELKELSDFKAFSKDHVLFVEGSPVSQLFIVTDGWVCRSKQTHGGEIRDSIGKGSSMGREGVIINANYPYTATAMGRTEVLEINIIRLRQAANLKTELARVLERFDPGEMGHRVATYAPAVRDKFLATQERLIDKGLVDATNLLVMDMDLCVRCGNCSMACHKVHGKSRLVRRGIHITRLEPKRQKRLQSLLSPTVCMHCNNPECLTGCPTGAIARQGGGQIDIDSETCIGCGDCATQCPYDAIFMVPLNESTAAPRKDVKNIILSKLRLASKPSTKPGEKPAKAKDDLLAVKCNLCSNVTSLNPTGSKKQAYSCEENCPTGALARIVPDQYFAEIRQIDKLRMIDDGHAYGRNIQRGDPRKRRIHAVCILLFLSSAALTVAGLQRYGYGLRVWGFLNMRWLTGFVGVAAAIGAAAYQCRRKVYRRRFWPLRYWMLVHSYLGVTACFILLAHGGTSGGGWLTKALKISFDLVIVTGLFGLICYQIIPRLLTRIEESPLLMEDLKDRRDELLKELSDITKRSPAPVGSLIKEKVVRRFDGVSVALQQLLKPESLDSLIFSAKKEFLAAAEKLNESADRLAFEQAVSAAALLPRVRALLYLHHVLKAWLVPHIASVYFMFALLVVHIIQVIYGS